jgi:hypothetical protein
MQRLRGFQIFIIFVHKNVFLQIFNNFCLSCLTISKLSLVFYLCILNYLQVIFCLSCLTMSKLFWCLWWLMILKLFFLFKGDWGFIYLDVFERRGTVPVGSMLHRLRHRPMISPTQYQIPVCLLIVSPHLHFYLFLFLDVWFM